MTINVERRNKYFKPEKTVIEGLIVDYLPATTVSSIELIHSGLANSNYRVTLTNGVKVILRFHTREAKISAKEWNLTTLLKHETLVPKILLHDNTCQKTEIPYSIVAFHEGILFSELLARDDAIEFGKPIFAELGRFIAHLNNSYRFVKPGSLDDVLHVSTLKVANKTLSTVTNFILSCLENKYLQSRLNHETIDCLRESVIKNDHYIMPTNDDSFLVHADLKPENILVKPVAKGYTLSAILDWEFCYSGSYYGDFGSLFRETAYAKNEFQLSFAQGYESIRPGLNKEWRKISKLIDLINLCDFLTSANDRPQLFDKCRRYIQETLNELN